MLLIMVRPNYSWPTDFFTIVIEPTRADAILDMVLVSNEAITEELVTENNLVLSDHKLI